MKYIDAEKLRSEIERRKNYISVTHFAEDLLSFLDTLEEPVSDCHDLEEEIREYMSNDDNNPYDWDWRDKRDCARHFAEWGEKNAYKAIMKKADEVRDKRFDTDYEIKIEPAAGFDFGCVNVYREGKLVGQYVEPKEEKRLSEGVAEAAIDFADYARKQLFTKDYAISSIADYDHGCIDGFKAGAEWQARQLLKSSPLPEDTVIFQKGVEEGKRLMMEGAVEADVNIYRDLAEGKSWAEFVVEMPTNNLGDKVKIIIVKEDGKCCL